MNPMNRTQKLTTAGVLIALGVALSTFSIPVGASRCFPVQHMVNVMAGVLLGPGYAVVMAFITSFLRVMMGTGTLLAFPGSMIGALVAGLVAQRTGGKLLSSCAGELFGTGVLGAMAAYPVAVFLLGREAAVFTYVIPFAISSTGGVVIAFVALSALQRVGAIKSLPASGQ